MKRIEIEDVKVRNPPKTVDPRALGVNLVEVLLRVFGTFKKFMVSMLLSLYRHPILIV